MSALGIIYDEPFSDYLSADAVSPHRLEDLRPRPLIYYRRWIEKSIPRQSDTPAFAFGRLLHCLALEGEDAMNERYVCPPPDCPKRPQDRHVNAKKPSEETKAAAQWWNDFDLLHAGKEQTDAASMDLCWRMVKAVRAKPAAVALMERGNPEVTFRHQLTNFAVQARVDWFDGNAAAGPLQLNLKSIDSLEDFDYQFEKFGYYKSDAFYRLVLAKLLNIPSRDVQVVNLVVEKQEPFEASIRTPDAESLAIGEREVMSDLRLLSDCYASGKWPGESADPRPVSLSPQKIRRALEAA